MSLLLNNQLQARKRVVLRRKNRPFSQGIWRTIALYVFLVPLAIVFLLPFYIMLRNAFLTENQIAFANWIWLPLPPQLQSWSDLLNNDTASITSGLSNSAIISVCQVLGQVLFASMAGYGLARIPIPGRNIIFYLILFTLMIPGAVTFIPTYLIVANLGWINTLQGIIVPGLFNAFAALLFRQFYLDFPRELEEAGRIDGLGYWGIYWRILLPNSRSILFSLGLLAFVSSWNAFLWPLVVGQDTSLWTVQVVLSSFLTEQAINLPALFMGAIVGILPVLLIFFFLQRFIVEGIARSGARE